MVGVEWVWFVGVRFGWLCVFQVGCWFGFGFIVSGRVVCVDLGWFGFIWFCLASGCCNGGLWVCFFGVGVPWFLGVGSFGCECLFRVGFGCCVGVLGLGLAVASNLV